MIKKGLILLSILLLSGCTSKTKVEEINFSSWGSITEVEIIKTIIKDFEEENPNIKINFIHIPQNYFQKLHLLIASKTEPDVIFVNNIYLPTFKNYLEPLEGNIEKKNFYKQAIDSLSIDNKLYAAPRDISNLVFYVNTELVPDYKTIKKLEDIVEITKTTKQQNIFGLSYEEDLLFVLPYITYFGEDFIENFIPEKSFALEYYKKLRKHYKIAPTKSEIGSSTLAQMFLDGKIAFYLSGRWMYPKISEKATFSWEIMPFPDGLKPHPCDSSGWAISKNSKHKQSALKFVQYLSSEKSSYYFIQTGLIVPARKKTSKLLNNENHYEKAFIEIIDRTQPLNIPINYKKIADKIGKML